MNRMSFIGGIGLGMAAGAVIGMSMPRKKVRSSVGKMMRSMGDTADRVAGCFKL